MSLPDGHVVLDDYDPTLGVLLCPDLDQHFNAFEASIYITVRVSYPFCKLLIALHISNFSFS